MTITQPLHLQYEQNIVLVSWQLGNRKTGFLKNFDNFRYVNMEEKMRYTPDPLDKDKTLLHQEMIVTVQGVPLTSYMEGIIVNTVSNNSSKGRAAIEWVVEKLGQECR